ncbi:hypothetical protein ACQ4LE_005401 [Meloidogyne hapla]
MKYLFLLFFLFFLLNQQLVIGLNNNSENNKRNIFDWIFHRHKHNSKNETKELNYNKNYTKCVNCLNPIIKLTGGKIKGRISFEAGKDKPAIVFEGIPFSEPPIGKLRFSPLKDKKPWNGILNTTKYSAACLSNSTRTRSPQKYISEDCIYINIFTSPKCLKNKNCPILFYIHGGGFAYDSATMFNETEIVQKYSSDGIIFVIPAYRLGVFGLLDLGNDKIVKRNLAMHDIIFGLEWVQKEIHNFGGNNKRITAMGNSAGASALIYLCGSPAVREGLFHQAFISSGVPFFTKDTNLKQSFALLEHFNCLQNNLTNKTFSDQQKVECLRKIDSLDLLRQQQYNEDFDIIFNGPESDTEILPFDNFVHLLRNWKPIPLMFTTTTVEFDRWSDDRLDKECYKSTSTFGYYSIQSYNACYNRYKDEFNFTTHMRVSYETLHSESFLTSLVNTRFGGISYVGEFEIANYSNHANDMYFFIGLHPIPLNRTDLKLMNDYYPKMVKNFIRGHSPDKNWRPQNWNGRNYFRVTFNVSDNNTILEAPNNVDGYQDVKGLDFWLHDMAIVERKARHNIEGNYSNKDIEEDNWLDLFGNKKDKNKFEEAIKPFLPIIGSSFSVLPSDNISEENETEIVKNDNYLTSNENTNNYDQKESTSELVNIWSAFWILIFITAFLSIALLFTATTKFIYQHKNVRNGYSQVPNSYGIFNEKSRIITANGNNPPRYM